MQWCFEASLAACSLHMLQPMAPILLRFMPNFDTALMPFQYQRSIFCIYLEGLQCWSQACYSTSDLKFRFLFPLYQKHCPMSPQMNELPRSQLGFINFVRRKMWNMSSYVIGTQLRWEEVAMAPNSDSSFSKVLGFALALLTY